MNTQRPDQATLEKLIALGQCADDDPRISDALGTLKGNAYFCSIPGLQSFEWLRELWWADACAFTKALVRVEAARLTEGGGSVSAVKTAFRSTSAREELLAGLRALPIRDRLEHIAWDETRSLSCYPPDFAVCTAEDLKQLDPVTRKRLAAKLRERKKGPWHKLAPRLGFT